MQLFLALVARFSCICSVLRRGDGLPFFAVNFLASRPTICRMGFNILSALKVHIGSRLGGYHHRPDFLGQKATDSPKKIRKYLLHVNAAFLKKNNMV